MYPVIHISESFQLPLYSLMFFLGVFLAVLIGRRIADNNYVPKEDVLYCTVYIGIGLLIGSKILYFLTKLPNVMNNISVVVHAFEENWISTLAFLGNYLFGGNVFYGGLIGAVCGMLRYCVHFQMPIWNFADLFGVLVPFVHGFGRIGCFFAGCCYGIEYHGIGAVSFPENAYVKELSAVERFPIQLEEAFCNFICFFVLLFFYRKKQRKPGSILGVYLIYYTVLRFLNEFLRGDAIRGKIGFLTTSQWISLLLLPIGIALCTGFIQQRFMNDSGKEEIEDEC